MKFFSRIFGKGSRREGEQQTARHRPNEQPAAEPGAVPGMRQGDDRPLYREETGASVPRPQSQSQHAYSPGGAASLGETGGHAAVSVDPAGAGGIGFDAPSTSSVGSGLVGNSYASEGSPGEMRQEATSMVCSRCGQQVSQTSRFCSNCGAPLRSGAAEGSGEQTSTLSIAGLDGGEGDGSSTVTPAPLPPETQAAIDALPSTSALLVVRRGPNSGSRFLLDSDLTTAGRHPNSDIFLDDVTVSRRHVEFRRAESGQFSVADVGSLNGTYVNRERIESVVLTGGDEVQIGKYRLVFYVSPRNL